MRNAGRRAVRCSSVSRTTARHVEYRPRVELAGIRAKPHNHLSDFVRQAEPLHWTVVDHSCDNIGFKIPYHVCVDRPGGYAVTGAPGKDPYSGQEIIHPIVFEKVGN